MSIILGYKSESQIYLAADNRVTNKENNSYSDNNCKLVILNDNLAVACAGSFYIQTRFQDIVSNKNTSKWTVEDVAFQFDVMCASLLILNNKNMNRLGGYFIIGGLDRHDKSSLWSASWNNKKFMCGEVEGNAMLFPPEDVDMQTCCNIYVRNYNEYSWGFMQKTIKEISRLGTGVSLSGDVWTYDFKKNQSNIEHFE